MDEIGGDVEDIDGVREIAEDVDECFGHLAAHVKVGVLVLQQFHSVLNGAVRGKVLHDLSIDEEEDIDLVLWQIRVLVFLVQRNGGIQKRFPDVI